MTNNENGYPNYNNDLALGDESNMIRPENGKGNDHTFNEQALI